MLTSRFKFGSDYAVESKGINFTYKTMDKTAYQKTLNFYSFFIFIGIVYAFVRHASEDFNSFNFIIVTFVRVMIPFNIFITCLFLGCFVVSLIMNMGMTSQQNYFDGRRIVAFGIALFQKCVNTIFYPKITLPVIITVYPHCFYGLLANGTIGTQLMPEISDGFDYFINKTIQEFGNGKV